VLEANAVITRESLEGRGRSGARGATGSTGPSRVDGSDAAARARAALWGLPTNPADRALADTEKMLEGMRSLDALAEHRALTNAAAGVDASARNADPRIAALRAVPAAEYDMTRDALRAVDHIADAEGAGEIARSHVVRHEIDKSDLTRLPWGKRPVRAAAAAAVELETALREEDEEVDAAREAARDELDTLDANLGAGAGEALVARARGGRGTSRSPTPVARAARARAAPGVNVVRENETAGVSLAVYGELGSGAYRPPHLMGAITELKEAAARSKAEAEARRAEAAAAEKKAEDARKALIFGKKPLGSGSWKKTRFGTMNFVPDDETLLGDPVQLAKRDAATARKAVRTDFAAATQAARESSLGQLARKEQYLLANQKAKVDAAVTAMDEDERALKEYADQAELLKRFYLGGVPDPKSDGTHLARRQRLVADMIAADAPKYLAANSAALNVPAVAGGGDGGGGRVDLGDVAAAAAATAAKEPAILMRKPAYLSSILRPKRFRVDTRSTIDAERVMAEGEAFNAMVANEDVLTLAMPPDREPVRRPAHDDEGVSVGVAATLEDATPSQFALEVAKGSHAEEAEAAALHTRGLRLLAGRNLMVPKRPGYGQIAANEANVLPAASFKVIAARSAELQPAGTTKSMIMHRAIAEFEGKIAASSSLSTVVEEKAKIERVRASLAASRLELSDEIMLANEGRAHSDMALLDQVDYMAKIPKDPSAKKRPKVIKVDGRSDKEKRIERETREDDARLAVTARAELARLEALRESKPKKEAPTYGTSMLATWPLHRAGPLPAAAPAGDASAAGGSATMVYRQYAVLDSVAASKKHAAEEKEAMIASVQKRLASTSAGADLTSMDVRVALESSRGVGQSAAAKARAAALSAHARAKAAASTLGQLMFASGDTRRTAAFGDEGVPFLTAAAAESEDFLARVRPANKNQVAFVDAEDDTRASRDRRLDVYTGTDDPWRHAKISWTKPTSEFEVG
jgi:hypothetical protein